LRWLLLLPLGFPAAVSFAQAPDQELPSDDPQQFTLFGAVDVESTADEDGGRPARRGRGAPSAAGEPEFTLVGTSRIGDRYSAILRHRDGTEVVVTAESGRNARIEGYSQFSVVDIGPGRATVQFPAGSDCIEFASQGVSCNTAGNTASLELSRGDPIPRAVVTARQEEVPVADDGEVVASEEQPEEPTNPFAALRARALQQNGDAPLAPASSPRRAFTPRRIDPAEIPPGYRVVSTPFGDRLVRE
jgi:hypothetical protein